MRDEAGQGWEQPPFEEGLDAIAVDLITTLMQEVFAELDPVQLVANSGLDLSEEDRARVAEMIDRAIVEIEVGFPRDLARPRPTLISGHA